MDKIYKNLEEINDSKEFKIVFDYEKDAEFCWNAFMNYAKNIGIEGGIEKGMKKGIEKVAKDVARQMLKENIEIHTISNLTGLNPKEIKKLI